MRRLSPEVEEYLETLYRFYEKGEKARTSEIAAKIGVAPASVSEMLKKLSAMGFVRYEPYKEAELTARGRAAGASIIRKHRVIERVLRLLGLRPPAAHEEACRLEHATSEKVEKAFESALSSPARPELRGGNVLRLTELHEGDAGRIAFISAGRHATQRLTDMGLTPGVRIKVLRVLPMWGPFQVGVRGTKLALGRGLVSKIFVEAAK